MSKKGQRHRWLWGRPRKTAKALMARLPAEIANLPTEHLQVSPQDLERIQVSTIGELIKTVADSDFAPPGWGRATRRQVLPILRGLTDATRRKGVVYWDSFLRKRPARLHKKIFFAPQSLGRIPRKSLERSVVQLNLRNRAVNLLRVRGIENLGQLIEQARLGLDLGTAKRSRAEVREALSALAESVDSRFGIDWRKYARRRGLVISRSRRDARFMNRFLSAARQAARIIPKRIHPQEIMDVARTTERLLTIEFPQGLSLGDLQMQLAKRVRTKTSLNELSVFVRSIGSVQFDKQTRRWRTAPGFLQRVDEFERVLRVEGKPLHYREILAKSAGVGAGRKITLASINTALSTSPRFTKVGHSGVWILTEWKDFETGTVAEVAVDLLKEFGPMTTTQLFTAISKRRPVSLNSLRKLFSRDTRLVRVDAITWDLADRSADGWVSNSKRNRKRSGIAARAGS